MPIYAVSTRRLLALGAAWLVMGCGGDGEATHSDNLPPVADDSCARFGFQFTEGGCPEATCAVPLCDCPTPIRCIPGMNDRCMSNLSCDVACAADPEELFTCSVTILPCRTDAECGAELCVVEPTRSNGECQSGERGARCRDDQDCHDGNCVAGVAGNRACSPGEFDDLCNFNEDCLGGRCVFDDNSRVGSCQ